MKTALTMFAILLLTAGAASAQAEEGDWKLFAKTGLNMTQSSFSDNWSGGEAGAVSWVWTFLGEAEKQIHPKVLWSNTLKMDFGQTHQYVREDTSWARPQKSTDRIRLDTIFRLTLGAWVDPYVASFAKTQFYAENESGKRELLNPVLLSESGGIARPIFEGEKSKMVTRVGFALRQLRSAFTGDVWSNDGGIEWVTDCRLASAEEKTVYLSKLTVYRAVYSSTEDDLKLAGKEGYWEAPDVDWENTVTNKLTEYLSLDFYFQWLYDKEQSTAGQYKQTLGVGLVYQFL